MNHFRRYWFEDSGGLCTGWGGGSWFYFEADAEGTVYRQVQLFGNGRYLTHEGAEEDLFGYCTDEPLDLIEYEEYRIERDDFIAVWSPATAANHTPLLDG